MVIAEAIKILKRLNACSEAVEDIAKYETAQEAWDDCNRGDWMLWLVGKLSGKPWSDSRKKLTLATCECARLAWDKMPKTSRRCIELFERWARGEKISKSQLKAAYAAAAYAADTAAAYAAYANAYAAATAAYAVATAAHTAYTKILAKCADIVRKHYPDIDAVLKMAA